MFDYLFPTSVEHKKFLGESDRYGNISYSNPSNIMVRKTESLVRTETKDGFILANKSMYMTSCKSVSSRDLVDSQIVKGVKQVLDINGDFVYSELYFE